MPKKDRKALKKKKLQIPSTHPIFTASASQFFKNGALVCVFF